MLRQKSLLVSLVLLIDRVPGLATKAAHLRQEMADRRLEARAWTRDHGDDDPDISGWTWPY